MAELQESSLVQKHWCYRFWFYISNSPGGFARCLQCATTFAARATLHQGVCAARNPVLLSLQGTGRNTGGQQEERAGADR